MEKSLPAMPIRVMYLAVERHVSMERRGADYIFRYRIPEVFTPAWDLHPSDAYNLREVFRAVKTPEQAFGFLSLAGPFRSPRLPAEESLVTWTEFQNWQALIQRIRLRRPSEGFPVFGPHDEECKDLFLRSDFWAADDSDGVKEQVWNTSIDTFYWLQGIPSGLMIRRDMYLSNEETRKIFSAPGADKQGSKAWHDAQRVLARRRAKKAAGNQEGNQRLYAQVATASALDAIIATIYVDNLRGLQTRLCALEDCDVIFEIATKHGKQYCCNYHAHLASVRRNAGRAKKKKKK